MLFNQSLVTQTLNLIRVYSLELGCIKVITLLALLLKSILDILGVSHRFFGFFHLSITLDNSPNEAVEYWWWRVFLLLSWSSWSHSLWPLLLFVLLRGLSFLIISGRFRGPDYLNGCNSRRRFPLRFIVATRTPPLSLAFPGLALLFLLTLRFRFRLIFGVWFLISLLISEIMLFSIIFLLDQGFKLILLLNNISYMVSLRFLIEYEFWEYLIDSSPVSLALGWLFLEPRYQLLVRAEIFF